MSRVLLSILPGPERRQDGLDYVARWREGDGTESHDRVTVKDALILKEVLIEAMRQSDGEAEQ